MACGFYIDRLFPFQARNILPQSVLNPFEGGIGVWSSRSAPVCGPAVLRNAGSPAPAGKIPYERERIEYVCTPLRRPAGRPKLA